MEANILTADIAAGNPAVIRGTGVELELDDGTVLLDAIAGVGVACLGYGNEAVPAAMARQGARLPFAHALRFDSEPQRELAREVTDALPPSLNHAYFVPGGSEAVESAVKFARQYWLEAGVTGKWKAIGRWPSFHGNTLFTQSLGWHQARRARHRPLLSPLPHIEAPNAYRGCGHCRERATCSLACAQELERAIVREGADTVSCFIAEPIGGAATGADVPPEGYFQAIREICHRHRVLLIADEIFTGFGRTGSWFAIDDWTGEPDIVTFGKGLGGGFAPLAGMAVSDRLVNAFREGSGRFEHSFTYAGHAVSCAAGLAVIDELKSRRLVERVREMSPRFFDVLGSLKDLEMVGDVRGRGFLAGVELVANKDTKASFAAELKVAQRAAQAALGHRLIVYPCSGSFDGHGDHLLLCPPFVTSEQDLVRIANRLRAALEELSHSLNGLPRDA